MRILSNSLPHTLWAFVHCRRILVTVAENDIQQLPKQSLQFPPENCIFCQWSPGQSTSPEKQRIIYCIFAILLRFAEKQKLSYKNARQLECMQYKTKLRKNDSAQVFNNNKNESEFVLRSRDCVGRIGQKWQNLYDWWNWLELVEQVEKVDLVELIRISRIGQNWQKWLELVEFVRIAEMVEIGRITHICQSYRKSSKILHSGTF